MGLGSSMSACFSVSPIATFFWVRFEGNTTLACSHTATGTSCAHIAANQTGECGVDWDWD